MIDVKMFFADGDIQIATSVNGECNEAGECAVHVIGAEADPKASVYLRPVDAALLGAELITAAREAVEGCEDTDG